MLTLASDHGDNGVTSDQWADTISDPETRGTAVSLEIFSHHDSINILGRFLFTVLSL